MRHLVPFAFVLLGACASSHAAPTARPSTQTVASARNSSISMSATPTADVTHLAWSADAVWRILPSVFDSMSVPVATIDQVRKTIGNPSWKTRARLGKAPLSRYLDCGNTQIGPNADSYDVLLSVLTTVTPEGANGATLTTIVEAQAKPVTYNQAYSRCSSKGGIEMRIAELVKARLAR
jgi:hypothetical protein